VWAIAWWRRSPPTVALPVSVRRNRVVDRFDHRLIAIGDFDEQGTLRWLDCAGVMQVGSRRL